MIMIAKGNRYYVRPFGDQQVEIGYCVAVGDKECVFQFPYHHRLVPVEMVVAKYISWWDRVFRGK